MIQRFAGLTPTRSRAVAHDDLVFTVAVAPDPVSPSMYEQSAKALARIDESLALCGSDKSKILSAIVYNRRHQAEGRDESCLGRMGRSQESADASLSRRRSRTAAYRRDRGDGGEVSCDTDRASRQRPSFRDGPKDQTSDAQLRHQSSMLRIATAGLYSQIEKLAARLMCACIPVAAQKQTCWDVRCGPIAEVWSGASSL